MAIGKSQDGQEALGLSMAVQVTERLRFLTLRSMGAGSPIEFLAKASFTDEKCSIIDVLVRALSDRET